jgi:hypothetical protein
VSLTLTRRREKMKALTHDQLAAITLYCQGLTKAEIARELGKTERTIFAWIALPQSQAILLDFSENYRKNLAARADRLQSLALDACEEIVSDRDKSDQSRLTAARLILSLHECAKPKREHDENRARAVMIDLLCEAIPDIDLDTYRDRYGERATVRAMMQAANIGKATAAAAMSEHIERILDRAIERE